MIFNDFSPPAPLAPEAPCSTPPLALRSAKSVPSAASKRSGVQSPVEFSTT